MRLDNFVFSPYLDAAMSVQAGEDFNHKFFWAFLRGQGVETRGMRSVNFSLLLELHRDEFVDYLYEQNELENALGSKKNNNGGCIVETKIG